MAQFSQEAVDEHVPEAIRRDVARLVSGYRSRGATSISIWAPAIALAEAISALIARRGLARPFTPTLCGVPIAPWEKDLVAVMGDIDGKQPGPVIYGADGKEIGLATSGEAVAA